MKRLTLLAVLTSAAALAASRSESTTYVDGNLTGVSPNTGGTLLFSDDKAMYFRTGLSNIPVPYAGISKVELGAVKETSHDVPLYKVWALHKRFSGGNKTETRLVIVEFKNEEGEDKSMTLEVAQPAVDNVLTTLGSHTGKTYGAAKTTQSAAVKKQAVKDSKDPQAKNSEWWGDEYWKTTRNTDKWSKTATTNDQH